MKYGLLIISAIFLCDTIAKAQDFNEKDPEAFGSNYALLELQSNYPTSFSQNEFAGGAPFGAFSYRHTMDDKWIMGVGFTFKLLKSKDPSDGPLSIWTIHHEGLYIIRLYHPTYFLVGTRLLYMVPAEKHTLPLQRSEDFETEIGAAITASIVQIINESYAATLRIDRWRGTRTQIFHGVEVALGLMYNLD